MHIFYSLRQYLEKSWILASVNDLNARESSQHVVRDASLFATPSSFPSLLLFLREHFFPILLPPGPSRFDLYYISQIHN